MAHAEHRPRPPLDRTSPTTGSIDESLERAERIRATLERRVVEVRARLHDAEASLAVSPELLVRLGGVVAEAERLIEAEGAEAGVVTDLAAGGPRP